MDQRRLDPSVLMQHDALSVNTARRYHSLVPANPWPTRSGADDAVAAPPRSDRLGLRKLISRPRLGFHPVSRHYTPDVRRGIHWR